MLANEKMYCPNCNTEMTIDFIFPKIENYEFLDNGLVTTSICENCYTHLKNISRYTDYEDVVGFGC